MKPWLHWQFSWLVPGVLTGTAYALAGADLLGVVLGGLIGGVLGMLGAVSFALIRVFSQIRDIEKRNAATRERIDATVEQMRRLYAVKEPPER